MWSCSVYRIPYLVLVAPEHCFHLHKAFTSTTFSFIPQRRDRVIMSIMSRAGSQIFKKLLNTLSGLNESNHGNKQPPFLPLLLCEFGSVTTQRWVLFWEGHRKHSGDALKSFCTLTEWFTSTSILKILIQWRGRCLGKWDCLQHHPLTASQE